VAINFMPNSEGIGLEAAGVKLTERKNIAIDGNMRTNVPNIYAIGDVATDYRLAHVASAMAIVAAESIAGHPTHALEFRMMPRCTYGQPQVASFGYTEAAAKEAGYEVRVGQFPFQPNGKALGLGERDGFVKIIADAKYGEILGAHLVGPDVTEPQRPRPPDAERGDHGGGAWGRGDGDPYMRLAETGFLLRNPVSIILPSAAPAPPTNSHPDH